MQKIIFKHNYNKFETEFFKYNYYLDSVLRSLEASTLPSTLYEIHLIRWLDADVLSICELLRRNLKEASVNDKSTIMELIDSIDKEVDGVDLDVDTLMLIYVEV